MSFPTYPEYSPSEADWLGRMPSHWTKMPLFALVQERDESNLGMRESNLLSLSFGQIVRKNIDDNHGLLPASFETYQVVETNDVIWRLTDLQNDKRSLRTAIARERGIITSAYLATRPTAIHPEFLNYLLRAYDLSKVLYSMGGGLRQSLKFGDVKWLPVFRPTEHEQAAIASFLDGETAKIDALVEEQERLVALLKEKRQAVISHAVTKGLNPDAPMKNSGIEWLGDVPAHWEVRKLTDVSRLESGHTPSKQRPDYWVEDECVIPWFTLADVSQLRSGRSPRVHTTSQHISEIGMENSAARLLPVGTVVLSRTASVGFAGITETELAVSQDFAAWICGEKLDSEYLLFVLQSMRQEFSRLMMGSTHKTIYMPDIAAFQIPLPTAEEQGEITGHLARILPAIDALIDASATAIRLITERRAALISAAVTGKIDVRAQSNVVAFPTERARLRGLVATEIIERLARQPTFGRVKLQKVAFLAEQHAGIGELEGSYLRVAAGPLDEQMVEDMQREAGRLAGISTSQPDGVGTTVSYRVGSQTGAHSGELKQVIGPERFAALTKLIADLSDLSTHASEAIATLYAVWNDALLDGKKPTDDEVIHGFLNDWHPEKKDKFKASDLPQWLDWMRRHQIVPQGKGSKTSTGRLFA